MRSLLAVTRRDTKAAGLDGQLSTSYWVPSTTPFSFLLDVAGRPKCFHLPGSHLLRQVTTTLAQTYGPLPRRSNRTSNFLTVSLLHGWHIPLFPCCSSSSGYSFPQTKHNRRSPTQRMISSQLVRLPNRLPLPLPVCHATWP